MPRSFAATGARTASVGGGADGDAKIRSRMASPPRRRAAPARAASVVDPALELAFPPTDGSAEADRLWNLSFGDEPPPRSLCDAAQSGCFIRRQQRGLWLPFGHVSDLEGGDPRSADRMTRGSSRLHEPTYSAGAAKCICRANVSRNAEKCRGMPLDVISPDKSFVRRMIREIHGVVSVEPPRGAWRRRQLEGSCGIARIAEGIHQAP